MLGLALIMTLAGLVGASPASAATKYCNGTLTGTYDRVIVGSGSTCTLSGATVRHNVVVQAGGGVSTPGTLRSTAISSPGTRPPSV